MTRNRAIVVLLILAAAATGCDLSRSISSSTVSSPASGPAGLRDAAVGVISHILTNPVQPITDSTMTPEARRQAELARHQFQALALEAAARFPAIVQPGWLEQGLNSKHDGVCYAALLAVGQLARYDDGRLCKPFVARMRQFLDDRVTDGSGQSVPRNPFTRLAAAYACYRLTGDADAMAFMPEYLTGRVVLPPTPEPLSAKEQELMITKLRCETIYVLSLMPQSKPQEMILKLPELDRRRAAEPGREDAASMVKAAAYCRLAVLGDSDALNAALNMVRGPRPDDALDALAALDEVKLSNEDLDALRVCLEKKDRPSSWIGRSGNQPWLVQLRPEVRVAVARTLGLKGDTRGQGLAMKWLNFQYRRDLPPDEQLPDYELARDPLSEYRVRFLAALALGAIGNYDESAGPLLRIIQTSTSTRFKLTAARAALELLHRSGRG